MLYLHVNIIRYFLSKFTENDCRTHPNTWLSRLTKGEVINTSILFQLEASILKIDR